MTPFSHSIYRLSLSIALKIVLYPQTIYHMLYFILCWEPVNEKSILRKLFLNLLTTCMKLTFWKNYEINVHVPAAIWWVEFVITQTYPSEVSALRVAIFQTTRVRKLPCKCAEKQSTIFLTRDFNRFLVLIVCNLNILWHFV